MENIDFEKAFEIGAGFGLGVFCVWFFILFIIANMFERKKMTRKFDLRKERKKHKLTQREVIEGVPIPNSTYRRHERTGNFSELEKRGYIHFFNESAK